MRSGRVTPAFSGAHKRAEVLPNRCMLPCPQTVRQNQNWVPHSCLLGGATDRRKCYVTPDGHCYFLVCSGGSWLFPGAIWMVLRKGTAMAARMPRVENRER